jgi:hypothetical protein
MENSPLAFLPALRCFHDLERFLRSWMFLVTDAPLDRIG